MKITVCKGCRTVLIGKAEDGSPACPICIGIDVNSGVPLELEVPEQRPKCPDCGEEWGGEWPSADVPFLALGGKYHTTLTYYCGCRGWD